MKQSKVLETFGRISIQLMLHTRSLLLWFLSKLAHWKLDNELTENHDDPDPDDLIDAIDWRLALDLTDLPETWLEEDAAAIRVILQLTKLFRFNIFIYKTRPRDALAGSALVLCCIT